jgi:hypothetical protein
VRACVRACWSPAAALLPSPPHLSPLAQAASLRESPPKPHREKRAAADAPAGTPAKKPKAPKEPKPPAAPLLPLKASIAGEVFVIAGTLQGPYSTSVARLQEFVEHLGDAGASVSDNVEEVRWC